MHKFCELGNKKNPCVIQKHSCNHTSSVNATNESQISYDNATSHYQ